MRNASLTVAPDVTTSLPLVVGIGGSAGSIPALQQFFDALPEAPGAAFVVVVHLPADQDTAIDEVLRAHTAMPVQKVAEPTEVKDDHVYVARSDRALVLEDTTLRPVDFEPSVDRRAPIDQLFRSMAGNGESAVGVLLSGAGSDGAVGLRAIEEAGGLVAVQDPSEAEHDVMPRSAIRMSRTDLVLPVAELAQRIGAQVETLGRLPDPEKMQGEGQEGSSLDQIFQHIRSHTGHDFSEYKRSTMLRRVRRRMQIHQVATLDEYLQFLREHPDEVQSLQTDLLISVTSFFRDPESFEALQNEVIPQLFEGKRAEDSLRVWVVGTATGEEAYSLAMMLLDHAATRTVVPDPIQVFGTDLDGAALSHAREGRYPEPIAADVPQQYLDRYFEKRGAQYRVKKHVREHVLFTPHNLLSDPPFANLDLISCRNLLIYLKRDLQSSVFDLFRYALRDDGYLFLGGSESAEEADEAFQTVNKSHRIYRRREGGEGELHLPTMPLSPTASASAVPVQTHEPVPTKATAHQRLLEAYSPPSVVVDENYEFVHLSGRAGRYLEHPAGTPSNNIIELVRPELQVKMRSVLHEAFSSGEPVQSQPVRVQLNGVEQVVRLVARPGSEEEQTGGLVLVVFEEREENEGIVPPKQDLDVDGEGEVVEKLRAELKQTREKLRATVEEYQTSQQKIQAANEELRSMNEELETSKEELQSVNEELKTVNRELEEKVKELRQANSDLKNVMASTQIGTLFLDRDLCIQRYTPRVEELFNVRPEDRGRPIGDLTHHFDYDALGADAQAVLADLQPVEREVQSDRGDWFLVRIHPYRTLDDKIDGVVIVFIDITERREAERALRRSEEFHRLAVEAARVGTWDLDLEAGDCYLSDQMAKLMGYSPDQFSTPRGHWQQVVPQEEWLNSVHPDDREAMQQALQASTEQRDPFELEFRIQHDGDSVRWLYSKGAVTRTDDGLRLHGASIDVTESREAKEQLKSLNEALEQRNKQVQSLSDALVTAEERERNRIGQVLHDDLQQKIYAARLKVENLRKRADLKEQQDDFAARAMDFLDESIETTRTLSTELNPPVEDQSLREALEWLAMQMQESYGLSVTTRARGTGESVDRNLRLLLFRMTRELLFNVVRHANVEEASLRLIEGEERLRVVVEDEGQGFDPDAEMEEGTGLGLDSIRDRIEMIGGRFLLDAAPGAGTRIGLEVPWRRNGA